jgi:CcmD family protein
MSFLVAAFIGVWLLVTGYVVYLGQRQRQLHEEMTTLEEMLSERNRATRGSAG